MAALTTVAGSVEWRFWIIERLLHRRGQEAEVVAVVAVEMQGERVLQRQHLRQPVSQRKIESLGEC